MRYEELEKEFLGKPGAWLDYPFGQQTAVFKVSSKMFGFIAWDDDPMWMNLKCDPMMHWRSGRCSRPSHRYQ